MIYFHYDPLVLARFLNNKLVYIIQTILYIYYKAKNVKFLLFGGVVRILLRFKKGISMAMLKKKARTKDTTRTAK